jgi:hypothetical protein
MRPAIALIATSLLFAASDASAAWPAGGKFVESPGDINGLRYARFYDLPSGDLGVLGVGISFAVNYSRVQRISRNGDIAPGWPADGVRFDPLLAGAQIRDQDWVVSDSGDVWRVWDGGSASAEFASASGSLVPQSAPFTFHVTGGIGRAAAAPDGDMFVAFGADQLTRITRAGTISPEWPADGVGLFSTSYEDCALMPDGTGGVLVFMRRAPNVPRVWRIDRDGSFHPGWPDLVIGSAASTGTIPGWNDSQLLPSGPDHVIAAWSAGTNSGVRKLTLQRFGLDGTLDPAWPPAGLQVFAADTLVALTLVPDGIGGVYVLRQLHGVPVATHVGVSGAFVGSADASILDVAAQYIPTRVFGHPGTPDAMIGDRTPNGGLLVGWNDTRLAPTVSFRLRWLLPDLTLDPSKPDTGIVVFPASPQRYPGSLLALHADGADGAYVAWGDFHDIGGGQGLGDLWMTRVLAPELVAVPPPATLRSVLTLSVPRPNPSRGSVALDVTLPDEAPARVALLDLAGRIVRKRALQGVGAHSISFDDLASLSPGLYFARVSHRSGERSVRVVLAR